MFIFRDNIHKSPAQQNKGPAPQPPKDVEPFSIKTTVKNGTEKDPVPQKPAGGKEKPRERSKSL